MSKYNDFDRTKTAECFSNSEEVENYAKKKFPRELGHSSHQEQKKKNVLERTLANPKDGGINPRMSCWKFQRKWTPDVPRYECVESRSLEQERWMYDSLHLGIIRTQNFYFARFTKQISSVSTEQ